MKLEEIENQIQEAYNRNVWVRIYFKHRSPIFGKFVDAGDFKDLLKKKYVRFLNRGKWARCLSSQQESFLSKLFFITDFEKIEEYGTEVPY